MGKERGLQNGKIASPKLVAPTPLRQGKEISPPPPPPLFVRGWPFAPPPLVWLKLQASSEKRLLGLGSRKMPVYSGMIFAVWKITF